MASQPLVVLIVAIACSASFPIDLFCRTGGCLLGGHAPAGSRASAGVDLCFCARLAIAIAVLAPSCLMVEIKHACGRRGGCHASQPPSNSVSPPLMHDALTHAA